MDKRAIFIPAPHHWLKSKQFSNKWKILIQIKKISDRESCLKANKGIQLLLKNPSMMVILIMMYSLPLCPPSRIGEALDIIKEEVGKCCLMSPNNEELSYFLALFLSYLERTWFKRYDIKASISLLYNRYNIFIYKSFWLLRLLILILIVYQKS